MTNEQTHTELWQLFNLCCKISPILAKFPIIRLKCGKYVKIQEPYTLKPNKRKFNYDFIYLITAGNSYVYSPKNGNKLSRVFEYFFECKELVLERIERAEKERKNDKDMASEIAEKCYKLNANTIKRYEKKISSLI